MTEFGTKRVYVFTTDSEEMANEIRRWGTVVIFVMDNKELRVMELPDDERLALITAIHMQQDNLAELIVDLSNQESLSDEQQSALSLCVAQADLLDDARRQLGDLWEPSSDYIDGTYAPDMYREEGDSHLPGETTQQHLESQYGLGAGPEEVLRDLDKVDRSQLECDPNNVPEKPKGFSRGNVSEES